MISLHVFQVFKIVCASNGANSEKEKMVLISCKFASVDNFYGCQAFMIITYALHYHFNILMNNFMHKEAQKMVI